MYKLIDYFRRYLHTFLLSTEFGNLCIIYLFVILHLILIRITNINNIIQLLSY